MPESLEKLTALAVVVAAVELVHRSSLKRENAFLRQEAEARKAQALYLAHLLDENDIEMDDFDMIAIANPM